MRSQENTCRHRASNAIFESTAEVGEGFVATEVVSVWVGLGMNASSGSEMHP